jgi:hypothetical protein
MLVKLKNPKKVYWDLDQKVVLSGSKAIEVKSNLFIRELMNSGAIVEVSKGEGGDPKDAKDPKDLKDPKLNPENTKAPNKETA